ncbi:hypothetical protein [Klebsiella pneumoniae ISC21]|nr:hypothetical protein [Klebsiella pneumoniae ISC21]
MVKNINLIFVSIWHTKSTDSFTMKLYSAGKNKKCDRPQ